MTLRARVLVALGVIFVVMIGVAWLVTASTYGQLVAQVDEQLVSAAAGDRERLPHTEEHEDGDDRVLPQEGSNGVTERLSPLYEAVITRDGSVITIFESNQPGRTYSPPSSGDLAERLSAAGSSRATNDPIVTTVDATDSDAHYRVAIRPVDDTRFVAIVRALPLDDVEESIRRMVAVELVGLAVVATVLAAVAWWVVQLGVQPVKQMTGAASRIAGGDLGVRVPTDGPPNAESTQLAEALNQMMTTIETAINTQAQSEDRLRRFVADASHELRTPLTTIRGYAELYRLGGLNDRAGLDDAMARTEEESKRMSRLVEDMLTLAKLDEERPLEWTHVDLAAVAAKAAADAELRDPDRPITLSVPEDGSTVVTGDRDRLAQVAANLVNNALVHTPAGTPINITVNRSTQDGRVRLIVADEGQGMEPDVAARVTERFFRADPSRSRARGGSGLGLSIVQAVVDAHHGTVAVDSAPGRGTIFTVELPRTQPTRA